MSPLERFVAYVAAFEKTYVDDDWSRLEQYMAPDVEYRVVGSSSWDCVVSTRRATRRA